MYACCGAASDGHLHVLQWLRSQDPPCPWDREKCRSHAATSGHWHIVRWIESHTAANAL
jgi:hypothetical protein